MKSFLFEGRSLPKTSKKKKKILLKFFFLRISNIQIFLSKFKSRLTSSFPFFLPSKSHLERKERSNLELRRWRISKRREKAEEEEAETEEIQGSPPPLSLSSQGETARRRWDDKKAPAGVIMITAVQRKTECCGARMAAVGSWEIGILERHFRVSGSCYQPPTTNNPVFRLLVPWPFPSPNLETRLSLS